MSTEKETRACAESTKPRVINIGISTFYEALLSQKVKATQLNWQPPVKQSKEMEELLDMFL